MNIIERFMSGLDAYKPDWFIIYANQRETEDYIRWIMKQEGLVLGRTKLRRAVAERLIEVVRAAMKCGLVEYILPKPTDTDATIDLVHAYPVDTYKPPCQCFVIGHFCPLMERQMTAMHTYNGYKLTVRESQTPPVAVFDPRFPRTPALYKTTSLDKAMRWVDGYIKSRWVRPA